MSENKKVHYIVVTPEEFLSSHRPVARLISKMPEEHHFTTPKPIKCKWCGSVDIKKYGFNKDIQEYICLKCGRKFTDFDAPYRKQSTVEQIGTSISSYYDGLSFAVYCKAFN